MFSVIYLLWSFAVSFAMMFQSGWIFHCDFQCHVLIVNQTASGRLKVQGTRNNHSNLCVITSTLVVKSCESSACSVMMSQRCVCTTVYAQVHAHTISWMQRVQIMGMVFFMDQICSNGKKSCIILSWDVGVVFNFYLYSDYGGIKAILYYRLL